MPDLKYHNYNSDSPMNKQKKADKHAKEMMKWMWDNYFNIDDKLLQNQNVYDIDLLVERTGTGIEVQESSKPQDAFIPRNWIFERKIKWMSEKNELFHFSFEMFEGYKDITCFTVYRINMLELSHACFTKTYTKRDPKKYKYCEIEEEDDKYYVVKDTIDLDLFSKDIMGHKDVSKYFNCFNKKTNKLIKPSNHKYQEFIFDLCFPSFYCGTKVDLQKYEFKISDNMIEAQEYMARLIEEDTINDRCRMRYESVGAPIKISDINIISDVISIIKS